MNPSTIVWRDEAELDRLVHYVEYNPVSVGLAANRGD
jgi:hypothetical protein